MYRSALATNHITTLPGFSLAADEGLISAQGCSAFLGRVGGFGKCSFSAPLGRA